MSETHGAGVFSFASIQTKCDNCPFCSCSSVCRNAGVIVGETAIVEKVTPQGRQLEAQVQGGSLMPWYRSKFV